MYYADGSGLGASGRRHDLALTVTEPVLTVQMVAGLPVRGDVPVLAGAEVDAPTRRVRVQQALREDSYYGPGAGAPATGRAVQEG